MISCDDCYIWYWRAFQFFMACALFVVFPCKYLQDTEEQQKIGRGRGRAVPAVRGGSPLMGPVACWFMGLFELWLGVLLYVINNWERGPCTATNWQKVAVESVGIARNKGLAGGNDWRRIAAARMMPKQVIGMPQETGLNLFLRSHQENNIQQKSAPVRETGHEPKRRRKQKKKKKRDGERKE